MNALLEQERTKYVRMWGLPQYRTSSPDEGYLRSLRRLLPAKCSINLYGCGPGRAGVKLALDGHPVTMLDIAANCLDPSVMSFCELSPERCRFVCGNLIDAETLMPPADWGLCSDVLEHLPPEWVLPVLEQMRRLTPCIFMSISHVPDVCGRWINDTLHLTVAPLEWWMPHVRALWPKLAIGTAGGSVSTLIGEAV